MAFEKEMDNYSAIILVECCSQQPIFFATQSPHSKLAKYIFANQSALQDAKFELYGHQIGTAVANLCKLIPVTKVYAKYLSEPAEKTLDELVIPYEYNELIPLVKSSKEPLMICPLEKSLVGLEPEEALKALFEKYQ